MTLCVLVSTGDNLWWLPMGTRWY